MIVNAASDDEVRIIPLSTGSIAEFYIEPMLSCIGDSDIMFHYSSQLAIPQGHPLPTQLPDEFHGRVEVYEIIDSGFPGYVYLVTSYLVTEITDDGKYNAVQCADQYVEHDLARDLRDDVQGPAFVLKYSHQDQSYSQIGLTSLDQCRHQILFPVYVVCRGLYRLQIGKHDTETTAGQTQQLLIVLSAMDVMW